MTTAPLSLPTDSFFPDLQRKVFTIGDKEYSFETGKIARSAQGSVIIRCDDTMVMVNVTVSEKPRAGIDFFPLTVDFEEKMYAVGRLPGGYLKREGRPSEKAILTSRLIDRPIRPLFPDGYRNDVQIVASPLALDSKIQPDILAMIAASMALELSGAPFLGPVGAVRVGCIDGELIINPTFEESEKSILDLVVAGTADSIMMVEAGCDLVPEELLLEAMDYAHEEIRRQVQIQIEFREQCGKVKKEFVPDYDLKPLVEFVKTHCESDIHKAYHNFDRDARKEILNTAKETLKTQLAALAEDHPIKVLMAEQAPLDLVADAFKKVEKRVMRDMVVNEGIRADGRKSDEIRPIQAEVGVIPRAHGSALFTRGSTQALSICTLGAPGDAQRLDGVDPATEKRWMHHYAFPPYSVGEARPLRAPGRREIGHGALAERANTAALPPKDVFPYTIRVNSEIVESNGSTSMASTCGTSLALMDAGVPVKCPIGGIAMGLIKEGEQFVILSDIQGIEDFLGDMDFKVTGNRTGVTALQMDIKIQGISLEIMRTAMEQARKGRIHILDKMAEALATAREELSPLAPRIFTIKINPDDIGAVIGSGGKTIRSIIEQTGAQIDIEDSGVVTITSNDGPGAQKAIEIIEKLTMKMTPGMVALGKVVRILPIGAFVELAPGKDGMVHISAIAPRRIARVEDALNIGDEVLVKVAEVDERGRVNLTIKGLTPEDYAQFGIEPLDLSHLPEAPPPPPRSGGGGGRPGGGGGGFQRSGGHDRGGRY